MAKLENQAINHTISMENQATLRITGVLEVISATDKGILCKLSNSHLQICGENLRVEKLSPEEHLLIIVGSICGIKYSGGQKNNSFLKKLFR